MNFWTILLSAVLWFTILLTIPIIDESHPYTKRYLWIISAVGFVGMLWYTGTIGVVK